MTTPSSTPTVSTIAQIRAIHDRLLKAEALVADGKVHPIYGMADHYIVDGSSAKYLVNGECRCPDAANRVELTKRLCKHRLAAMLYAEHQTKAETRKAKPTSEAESPKSDEELERKVADLYC
jgi:predicted nucleic acid-binding Zn finger protein